jgi:predicted glycoside hydrolase/deacetylase ChbG (UPF0249 family)
MVNASFAGEAAALSRAAPGLSVGLHVDLAVRRAGSVSDGPRPWQLELSEQFRCFQELVGRLPTHLDSHHNVHHDPDLRLEFNRLACEHQLPLRGASMVRPLSKFYGQWGGETHPEQISVENLAAMLATEVGEGVTELICHPGYGDRSYATSYSEEREIELRTLCDPVLLRVLAEASIELVSYHDIANCTASAAS